MSLFVIILIIAIIIILFSLIKKRTRKRNITCDCCNLPYDYDRDVSWTKLYKNYSAGGTTTTVEIVCSCHKCANKKVFQKSFVTRQNGKLNSYSYDLDYVIRQYFKQ